MYGLLLAVMFVATLLAHAWAAWALGTFVQRRLPHIRIPPSWPEVYAGGGLLLLALSSLLFGSVGFEAYVLFPSGLGFAAIAAGTFRLPAFYRMLGSLGLATDWTSASWGISESTPGTGYGQVKFVVEGGLCLCVTLMHLAWFIGAAALVAGMAALLLLTLYPCIWLPTMFFHLALAVQVAKRTRQVTRAAAV